MKTSRVSCDNCLIDIHRASFAKHSKSKKHTEIITKMIIIYVEKVQKNELRRIILPFLIHNLKFLILLLIDRILKFSEHVSLDNHHSNQANSILTITSKFISIGIDINYIRKIFEEVANIDANTINQYEFKNQISFSAVFNKLREDGENIDQIELPITSIFTRI